MQYAFCKTWFRAKKKPTELWSPTVAKAAHEAGTLYTVLVGSETRPSSFIEVTADAVSVGFLDAALRETLSYSFQSVGGGKLFLSMATYREFLDHSDVVASGWSYVFAENGSVSVERQVFFPPSAERKDDVVDVSENYTDYPAFGDYGDLVKIERG